MPLEINYQSGRHTSKLMTCVLVHIQAQYNFVKHIYNYICLMSNQSLVWTADKCSCIYMLNFICKQFL